MVDYSLNEVFKKYLNKTYTKEEMRKVYGPSEDGIVLNEVGEANFKNAFYDYLKIYESHHEELLKDFFPGIRELLMDLKNRGINVYLLTGRCKESLMISLTKLNAFDYFKSVTTGKIKGACKDELFLDFMKEYNLEKEDLIYIGESTHDIKHSKMVGIDVISVSYNEPESFNKLNSLNENNVAQSVDELKILLNKYLD